MRLRPLQFVAGLLGGVGLLPSPTWAQSVAPPLESSSRVPSSESAHEGEPAGERISLGFDEALRVGADTPFVRAPRAERVARVEGDREVGGTQGPTAVTLMPGAAFEPAAARGFDFQLNATQSWNTQGLGGRAREAAAAERAALSAEERARALEARLGVAHLWIELRTAEALIEKNAAGASQARQRVELARKGRAAGVSTMAELREAEAVVASLEERALELEGRRFTAASRLASELGWADRAPRGALVTRGEEPAPLLPLPERIREWGARLERLPAVELAGVHQRVQQARRLEAEAVRAPLFTLGAQLERSAGDVWVGYGIVGMTWSGPQGQRAVSSAQGAAARAELDKQDALRLARRDFEGAVHEWRHGEAQLALLDERTLPELRALAESRRAAVAQGEETRATWFAAEALVRAAEERRIETRGAALVAKLRLWLWLAALEETTE